MILSPDLLGWPRLYWDGLDSETECFGCVRQPPIQSGQRSIDPPRDCQVQRVWRAKHQLEPANIRIGEAHIGRMDLNG
jgi:hypothetical protein